MLGRSRTVSEVSLAEVVAGAFAFALVWGALSQAPAGSTVTGEYLQLTSEVRDCTQL